MLHRAPNIIYCFVFFYLVLVIAWARVPHVGYWHGSDVEPEGRRPVVSTSLPCEKPTCGMRIACAITNLLYESCISTVTDHREHAYHNLVALVNCYCAICHILALIYIPLLALKCFELVWYHTTSVYNYLICNLIKSGIHCGRSWLG